MVQEMKGAVAGARSGSDEAIRQVKLAFAVCCCVFESESVPLSPALCICLVPWLCQEGPKCHAPFHIFCLISESLKPFVSSPGFARKSLMPCNLCV